MKAVKKIYDALFKIINCVCIVFAAGMIFIMAYNVFMRYVMHSAPSWGDEMAQFCMIWFGLLSASVAMKEDRHIRIKFLEDALPPRLKMLLLLFIHLLACVVLVVLFKLGYEFLAVAGKHKMTGSRLPYSYLYVALPISAVCMLIAAVGRSCEIIAGHRP